MLYNALATGDKYNSKHLLFTTVMHSRVEYKNLEIFVKRLARFLLLFRSN